MPTWNDTLVRVEGLSKSTATERGPSSGRAAKRSFFNASARSRTSTCSAGVRSSSRRKCLGIRGLLGSRQAGIEGGGQGGEERVGLLVGEDERRGEPDDVVGDCVGEEAGFLQGRDDSVRHPVPK